MPSKYSSGTLRAGLALTVEIGDWSLAGWCWSLATSNTR
jgi:hypothetical protein